MVDRFVLIHSLLSVIFSTATRIRRTLYKGSYHSPRPTGTFSTRRGLIPLASSHTPNATGVPRRVTTPLFPAHLIR
ncbi:hypothetical protein F5I97DRAFT_110652 [Phlebopus sp. FC_14]|nr:hypothetical protein F5I97DRAFT_110652 [Phlebopus sp. FC_14]